MTPVQKIQAIKTAFYVFTLYICMQLGFLYDYIQFDKIKPLYVQETFIRIVIIMIVMEQYFMDLNYSLKLMEFNRRSKYPRG